MAGCWCTSDLSPPAGHPSSCRVRFMHARFLTRPYGRVDRPKLKRTLLERCVAAGEQRLSLQHQWQQQQRQGCFTMAWSQQGHGSTGTQLHLGSSTAAVQQYRLGLQDALVGAFFGSVLPTGIWEQCWQVQSTAEHQGLWCQQQQQHSRSRGSLRKAATKILSIWSYDYLLEGCAGLLLLCTLLL